LVFIFDAKEAAIAGTRVARSYDGEASEAPILVLSTSGP